jgi:hypothetical protein
VRIFIHWLSFDLDFSKNNGRGLFLQGITRVCGELFRYLG